MKTLISMLFICLLTLCQWAISHATVDYSKQMNKSCNACHIDPSGGGKLTVEGEAFKDDLRIKGLYKPLTTAQRIVRFVIGYLHTMTAIVWFGAILYVHILLKPAYAAKGLPRGELMLGWLSIVIMAITGTLLTIARVPSIKMLLDTRFGILLIIKIGLFLIMVFTAAVVTFVMGPKLKKRKQIELKKPCKEITMEELAQFDGKEGRPAYVAYKGSIYDMTNSRFWKDGSHARKHLAGSDLTDALKQSPHGEDKVTAMPLIGSIIQSAKKKGRPVHERVFFYFAYMNLFFVFAIVFVIALWRWW
ncbi:MAG: cytochrome b5 domain-containing protein [Thermodesulfovibrionales bacterium]|nr:cytochrome b5 domain-containing protein [Thermodesulfovibrionales bacterium]